MMQRKIIKSLHVIVPKTTITEDLLSSSLLDDEKSLRKEKVDTSKQLQLDLSENTSNEGPVATVVHQQQTFGTSSSSSLDRQHYWLNIHVPGLFCACLTYMLHIYGCHAVCNILIPHWMSYETEDGIRHITYWGYFHIVLFISITLMAIISQVKTMTIDPGVVPLNNVTSISSDPSYYRTEQDPELLLLLMKLPSSSRRLRFCKRCNSCKPSRAHHCSICNRCVFFKSGHHCPWVNNCIGIGNRKYFELFFIFTCISCTYAITLCIIGMKVCIPTNFQKIDNMHCLLYNDPTDSWILIGLGVESLLFGIMFIIYN